MLRTLIERFCGVDWLDGVYRQAASCASVEGIFQSISSALEIGISTAARQLDRIPSHGPVVVVANHPTGLLEGLALQVLLDRARLDSRTLSHRRFARYPKVAERMFLVDPQRAASSPRENRAALGHATDWVGAGRMLIVYPAGEVARFDRRARQIQDPEWQPCIARIIHRTRATVVPVHIAGRNSLAYHVLSAIHPRLGALLLNRELRAKRGKCLRAAIGRPIAFVDLPWSGGLAGVTEYLRDQVDELESHTAPGRVMNCGESAPIVMAD